MSESVRTKMVKKYKNRKLYDKEHSHYITLSDIKEYIRDGLHVVVKQDPAQKGQDTQDVTTLTKIQILLDEAQRLQTEGKSISFVSDSELDQIIKKMEKTPVVGVMPTPETKVGVQETVVQPVESLSKVA